MYYQNIFSSRNQILSTPFQGIISSFQNMNEKSRNTAPFILICDFLFTKENLRNRTRTTSICRWDAILVKRLSYTYTYQNILEHLLYNMCYIMLLLFYYK